jgi:Ca2+-binding RTX toxin-like protein
LEDDADLSISGSTVGVEDGQTVTVNVGGTDYSATVTANAFSVTVPSADLLLLAEGTVAITADVSDAAGNPASQAPTSVEYDATLPLVTIDSAITPDTGSDGADRLTNVDTLDLSGTVSDLNLDRVEIYDGATYLGDATVAAGSWSYSAASLAEGAHDFTARAIDLAGNSTTSAALDATVDLTAPSISIDTPISDGYINAAEDDVDLAITGTTVGAEDGQTVTVNFGGTDYVTTVSSDAFSVTVPSADILLLAEGPVAITADVSDAAGNPASQATASVTYDIADPVAVVTGFSNDSGIIGDQITSDDTLVFSGTAEADSSVELFIDGTSIGTATANGAGAWSYDHSAFTLAEGTYTLTAQATDPAGNIGALSADYDVTIINVTDVTPPTAVITVDDTSLIVGESAQVTISFSEEVVGFTNADLVVGNGTLSPVSTADGGKTWTATLTPDAGVEANGNVITLLDGSVSDPSGNSNVGAILSNTYDIDTLAPTPTIALDTEITADDVINIAESNGAIPITGTVDGDALPGDTITLSVTSALFTGTFTGTVQADLSFSIDVPGFALVADADSVIEASVATLDAAGNAGMASTREGYTVDITAPVPTITLDTEITADDIINIAESTGNVTITGTAGGEALVGDAVEVTVNGVTSAGTVQADMSFSIDVAGADLVADASRQVVATVTTVDSADNPGTATASEGYLVDTAQPTVTILVQDDALNIGDDSPVTIIFNEAVSGFDNADLSVPFGTLSPVTSSDGGVTWTATLAPNPGVESASNSITLDYTGVTDVAGNTGTGTTLSNSYSVDTLAPSAIIGIDDTALNIGDDALVTFTFNEAVTGFTNSDVSVDNGALSGLSTGDNVIWTATLTPDPGVEAGGNLLTLNNAEVADLAGNVGVGTTDSPTYTVDTIAPTLDSVTLDDVDLISGETAIVTFSFSEAASAFDLADITVESGSLGALSSTDGGQTWTATLTPATDTADATNRVSVAASYTDLAGNSGSSATSANYTVETTIPTATVTLDDTALKIGETATVTIAFSEAVGAFDNSDVTVENGILDTLLTSDGGITWTATFTPSADVEDTSNLVTLASSYSDLAGNTGVGATSPNYQVDTLAPSATISMTDYNLGIGETATLTIAFSEAVTAFDNSDVTVENGTLGTLGSLDGGVTWTATFTPDPDTDAPINTISLVNSYTDLAGNDGTAASSLNYVIDTTDPRFSVEMFTPDEFKVTGGSGLPVGSYDSSPAGQATREVINGTAGNDTIGYNSLFNNNDGESKWARVLHFSFEVFTAISTVALAADPAISGISGFDITALDGSPLTRVGDTWTVAGGDIPADIISNGLDLLIVYDVASASSAIDFGVAMTVSGDVAAQPFVINGNQDMTWREATSAADFTVTNGSGAAVMVLPSDGLGVEIHAGAGDDTVYAGAGHDLVYGDAGNDKLYGGSGDDVLDGGSGADELHGDAGSDTASYTSASTAVVASLANPTLNTSDASGDSYVSIENLSGSSYGDTLTGDGNANSIAGNAGNDALEGLGGADTLDGGSGTDTASYASAVSAVVASLADPTGNTNDAAGDSYVSIENLSGSALDDTLSGNGGTNVIAGGAGNDTLLGGPGRVADTLNGGSGNDTASYADAIERVTVSLEKSGINGGGASFDSHLSIENLVGSGFNDLLFGDAGYNKLYGGAGNDSFQDSLYKGESASGDLFDGGAGNDSVTYASSPGAVNASLANPAGNTGNATNDSYVSIENLTGTSFDDKLGGDNGNNTLVGSAGGDILEGFAGADSLIGYAGTDLASYASSATAIVASLQSPAGNTGDAAGDSYNTIEGLIGSDFSDQLTGDASNNVLQGGSGDDLLQGLAGADQFDGGAGTDTVSYVAAGSGVIMDLGDSKLYVDIGDPASVAHDGITVAGGQVTAYDTFTSIENVVGSRWNDTLAGDGQANVIEGGAGNDTIDGDGNVSGYDVASYAGASGGVTVDLSTSAAQETVNAGRDILINMEGLEGSAYNDSLSGDADDNWLDGGAGDDTLNADLGNDIIHAEQGHDSVDGGAGNDTIHVSVDTVNAPTTIEGGADSNSLVLHDLGGSYTLSDLAGVDSAVNNIDLLDIRDGSINDISISSSDIQHLVDDGAASQLTILADSGDILSFVPSGGDTMSPGFSAGVDATYIIDNGGTVAQINWNVA